VQQPVTDTLVWRWDTDPFGTAAPNENPSGLGTFPYNLRFPGQYYDAETGLNQNWNRDYDPIVGRYLESDPIGLAAGVDTYTYVRAKAVNRIDKTGLVTTDGSYATDDENTIICDGLGHVVTHLAPLDPLNAQCLGDCIEQHELSHVADAVLQNSTICQGQKKGILVLFSDRAEQAAGEIKASEVELACLRKKLSQFLCGKCDDVIEQRIKQMEKYRDSFK
jgi:RHS repeat-associated protein